MSRGTWNPKESKEGFPQGLSGRMKSKSPSDKSTAQTHITFPPHSLCSSLRQHLKIPGGQILNFYFKKSPFFLGISKNFLLPDDWLYILSFVLYFLFLPLQPLSPHSKQFPANLLRFLWGVVGNRTLLSNGISTSIWHPSWHFTLHIIIYSVM